LYKYQALYFGSGFGMLPMNPWEFWQPLVLIYVVTLFQCARRWLRGDVDAEVKWYLFVAMFGLGIFSYYQGRSHIWVLPSVIYPAFILVGFWLCDLCQRCRGADWKQMFADRSLRATTWKIAGCSLFLFCGVINLCRFLPDSVLYATGKGIPLMSSPQDAEAKSPALSPPVAIAAQFQPVLNQLKERLHGSRIIILSPIGTYIHLKTGTSSALPFPCLGEVILVSQVAQIQEVLDQGVVEQIVLDENAIRSGHTPGVHHLRFDGYKVVTHDGGIVLLEKIK
jgi:hypothetical protein